jgi:hypothetical protein
MKKLLIATLLFTGLAAFVPDATAGHRDRDNDRCDRPVYRQSYREDCRPSYRYYEERPVYYRAAPVVRYRSYDYDDCRPTYRTYRRPALSFVFGF